MFAVVAWALPISAQVSMVGRTALDEMEGDGAFKRVASVYRDRIAPEDIESGRYHLYVVSSVCASLSTVRKRTSGYVFLVYHAHSPTRAPGQPAVLQCEPSKG